MGSGMALVCINTYPIVCRYIPSAMLAGAHAWHTVLVTMPRCMSFGTSCANKLPTITGLYYFTYF